MKGGKILVCWHCWHKIENTNRKLKTNIKCKNIHQYISKGSVGFCVRYVILEECCKCKKKRIYYCEDYQVDRGLSYLSFEDSPLNIN